MTFTPSQAQAEAIGKIKAWYRTPKRQRKQIFRVFGYAGSGKTTTIKTAIEEIRLHNFTGVGRDDNDDYDYGDTIHSSRSGGVLYAAFTGKAALVMSRKGTPARTIHSLIYRVSEPTKEEMDKVKKQIADLLEDARVSEDEDEALGLRAQAAALKLRLKDMHKPTFVINPESDVRDADLIVLDEVSMVDTQMAEDLLSFGVPILVLGDPGQLPPIRGEGYFTQAEPDVMLTEIHRQAGESAIIRLATLARQGDYIPFGMHDTYVAKMNKRDLNPAQMLRAGQVICGKNATRFALNNALKAAAGFPSPYPTGSGEKIICKKNMNNIGLINGMFMDLINPEDRDEVSFQAVIKDEDGEFVGPTNKDGTTKPMQIYKGHFADHFTLDKDRNERDYHHKKYLVECEWGYAITGHKSQGSQWENVVVYNDGLGHTPEDRSRWLYTAITRAERGLVIIE